MDESGGSARPRSGNDEPTEHATGARPRPPIPAPPNQKHDDTPHNGAERRDPRTSRTPTRRPRTTHSRPPPSTTRRRRPRQRDDADGPRRPGPPSPGPRERRLADAAIGHAV
ncbi:hypothetical protein ACRAWF_19645 [Streptomyces sp. L7]